MIDELTLRNVGYIPDFCVSLFSITRGLLADCDLGNIGLAITLTKRDKLLAFDELVWSDHGYVCGKTLEPVVGNVALGVLGVKNKKRMSLKDLHAQLGHPSMRYTRNTALKIYGDKMFYDANWNCEDCALGKIARKAIAKKSTSKSTVPGQRLFVDISSVSTSSFGGSKFWVLAVDEYSNKKWCGFIKEKNLISKCLYEIIQTEGKLLRNLRYIRCDNGERTFSY